MKTHLNDSLGPHQLSRPSSLPHHLPWKARQRPLDPPHHEKIPRPGDSRYNLLPLRRDSRQEGLVVFSNVFCSRRRAGCGED